MPGGSGPYPPSPNDHWDDRYAALRAETPFTSPPLADDFDAITQRWSRTTRATTVEPTASGLYDQLEAVTRATTPFTAPRRRKKSTQGAKKQYAGEGSAAVAPGKSLRRMKASDRIKSGSANGRARVAPVAGQDYEMVGYRVLEEGAERTVSISTWREQAIQEADSDDDMSVYYVNAEDCARVDETEIVPAAEFVPLPARTTKAAGSGSNNSGHKSGESRQGPQHASTSAEKLTSSKARPSTSRNNSGTKTYQQDASPTLNASAPRTSTPRGSGTLVVQDIDAPGGKYNSSPFHATRSTGKISSIHLTPTPTLEHVLGSCQPSLIHISPILQRVGIMRVEHLRAVGKLSEDTRNREIKEDVLKLGVTVVEWAILLDRLREL